MRYHSTPESVVKGEITILGIAECFISVIAFILFCYSIGNFGYLTHIIALAPLTLLRTDLSTQWGLKTFNKYHRLFYGRDNYLMFIYLVLVPIVAILIRILGTIYWAIRKPLYTLGQMPQNWIRQCFCTDVFHKPEILPLGESTNRDEFKVLRFEALIEIITGAWLRQGILTTILTSIYFLPLLALGYLPSFLYRISFKATSFVYAPFVWIAHTTVRNIFTLKSRLERVKNGEIEKVRRYLSGLILGVLLVKIAFICGYIDQENIKSLYHSEKLVEKIIRPSDWAWWQISLITESVLTFGLLFFADSALARIQADRPLSERIINGTFSTVSYFRATLAALTISGFIYSALVEVGFFQGMSLFR